MHLQKNYLIVTLLLLGAFVFAAGSAHAQAKLPNTQEGIPAAAIFAFSLLCVFLILAAQYESWSLPFSVLLGTPIAVMGAFRHLFPLLDLES